MSKGDRTKRDRDRVAVDGPWLPLPLSFLSSRAAAELSPHAAKLLMFFIGQLGTNAYGNGRLDASANSLCAAGWTSKATAFAAINELEAAGLLVCTRRGRKGCLALYAVTLWPMHCKAEDLDHGPGAWTVKSWAERDGAGEKLTPITPARWSRPRQRTAESRIRTPRCGTASDESSPAGGLNQSSQAAYGSAAGEVATDSRSDAVPLGDSPSREAICKSASRPSRLASSAKQPFIAVFAQ